MMVKRIELTQGEYALVDNKDFAELNRHKWFLVRASNRKYAARKHGYKEGGDGKIISMHREIMGFPEGMDIDHIDGNGLNNQRSNMRVCTRAENVRNRKKMTVNNEKYIGIKRLESDKWRAIIGHTKNGKSTVTHLGMFNTPEAAAIAYDRAARVVFGEFANLNFPNGEPDIPEYQKQPTTRYKRNWWADFIRENKAKLEHLFIEQK